MSTSDDLNLAKDRQTSGYMGLQFVNVDFVIILTYSWSDLPEEALLSISLARHGQLVKMLITLKPRGIFSLNFAFLYISRYLANMAKFP